jgi:hypothetical protein
MVRNNQTATVHTFRKVPYSRRNNTRRGLQQHLQPLYKGVWAGSRASTSSDMASSPGRSGQTSSPSNENRGSQYSRSRTDARPQRTPTTSAPTSVENLGQNGDLCKAARLTSVPRQARRSIRTGPPRGGEQHASCGPARKPGHVERRELVLEPRAGERGHL